MATRNPSAKLIALPMASWPAAERQAWTAAIGPRPSLFGQAGRANHLRAATAASYANAVGQWLAHLQGHGWLLPHETPAERFQIERLNALMTDMDERGLKPSSMRQILIMLRSAMRFIDPVADFSMLTRPRGVSLSKALPSEPREVFASDQLVALPFIQRMHEDALVLADGPERRRRLRDAALVGFFVTLGPRRASVVRMRLDRLQRRDDGTWLVRFQPEDTKTHQRMELPLNAQMTRLMDDYLTLARPGFFGAGSCDQVWMGRKGPLTLEGVSLAYEAFSLACFGRAEGTHSARRMLRSTAGRISPELAFDAALTMGHSQEVSAMHYAASCTLHVGLRHGDRIRRQREGDKSPVPAIPSRPRLQHERGATEWRDAVNGRPRSGR